MDKNHRITLEGKTLEYILTKTRRKTVGISVDVEMGVKVAAPKNISMKQIEEVILKNSKWIFEKLKDLEGKKQTQAEFKAEESFSYLGKEYTLAVIEINNKEKERVELEEQAQPVPLIKLYLHEHTQESIKKVLLNWYRQEASRIIKERLECIGEKTGLWPLSVAIKDQKSRFGSCSSKKNINLNWKLVMAPMEVIDYVVLHELCHLREMNHSKDFWNLVESFMVDYKERRRWLKEYGGYIRLI
ncbi:M48 family metallopeptidase [Alkaliphilus hydrothermalis]|uniref:Metal-dependent hydrolase n=1 Tax=Alkaliphilus hydrothermalis TaxID=1482730 RepID=A0ABS2NT29_9FIRM|nr:SprT family zinc-dependent metalloprotease [Alkaliphilus hydrothermalis]MBM7616102.1 putative metal-dependent hydrolase [Alkaliphilus hydrothermalis]